MYAHIEPRMRIVHQIRGDMLDMYRGSLHRLRRGEICERNGRLRR
jgi:hypothetical protein